MTTDDPWKDLAPPSSADSINARRVDSSLPWGFFWARGIDNHCLLVLRHSVDSTSGSRLPRLKGVEMGLTDGEEIGARMLVLRLVESAHRDIFYRLCLDIVASAGNATTEHEAVNLFLARTWRWHHLLRGGGDGRLTTEEQKGLIGELIVLETLILPNLTVLDAVSTWRGPLGAPKDFEIGRVCIEAKARRGAATPYVAISSEYQLDVSGIDTLFLYVAELDQEQSAAKEGFTLTDIARRCRDTISSRDSGAVERFEALLTSTGFRWEDDYADTRWTQGRHHVYRIDGNFPAITAASCPAGISNVRYSLSLSECEPCRVKEDAISAALSGDADGG